MTDISDPFDPLGESKDIIGDPLLGLPRPEVALRRIRRISTYEVMEKDLEDLDQSMQMENTTLAFASLCLGSLISALLGWVTASGLSPHALAAYFAASIVLTVGSIYFSTSWYMVKKSRKSLLERIRSQTVITREEAWRGV